MTTGAALPLYCLFMQMDDKRHEEFARAKKFKKLNKLLNTPAAKRPITQFRNFAIAVLAILVIVQVIVFVISRTLLTQLNRYVRLCQYAHALCSANMHMPFAFASTRHPLFS